MKNKLIRWLSGAAVVASLVTFAGFTRAGYGSSGSYGGYASSYGSSGGLAYGGGSSGYGGGSSGGSYYAGYGSSGVASYGGGSSGGYVGPIRRLHNHVHNGIHNRVASRIAARSSYGSSGGSSGVSYSSSYGSSGGNSYGSSGGTGYGSSGGSSYLSGGSSGGSYYARSGSYGSSGGASYSGGSSGGYAPTYSSGSTGSVLQYGSYDQVPSHDGVIMEGTVIDHNGTPLGNNSQGVVRNASKLATSKSVDANEIHLIVNLPEEAKMFVNGNPTTSTGASRHFVSRNLAQGESYRFELKAVMAAADGKEIEKTKTIVLNSGNGEEINFDLRSNDELAETVLTLNVPEDASVVLANNVTKTSGSSRVYRTKQLKDGETWDDYKIQVTVAGVTKEKVIRLIGGDNLELTFNFDHAGDEKLAMK